ncbi:hypothetical protein CHS0354_007282, partial [Potamilus streckersoni]
MEWGLRHWNDETNPQRPEGVKTYMHVALVTLDLRLISKEINETAVQSSLLHGDLAKLMR